MLGLALIPLVITQILLLEIYLNGQKIQKEGWFMKGHWHTFFKAYKPGWEWKTAF